MRNSSFRLNHAGFEVLALLATYFHAGFLSGLLFNLDDGDDTFLRNRRLTVNGIHGVISQMTEIFLSKSTDCGKVRCICYRLFYLLKLFHCIYGAESKLT
jgi:hypothetical protein